MSRLLRRPALDRRPPPPAAVTAVDAVRRLDLTLGRQVDGLLYGDHAGRTPGLGSEAGESRRYAPGDDPRRIDWNVSARSQDPYVRDAIADREVEAWLVMDLSASTDFGTARCTKRDLIVAAAGAFALLASRAGDRVDLLAMDRRVRARVEGASRSELLPQLVTAMAPLEADLVEADWTAIAGTILTRTTQRALVVLLTPLESAAIEEGLLPVLPRLAQRHRVVVASVADPKVAAMAGGRGDAYAVYGAAAAARSALERSAVTAELGRLGVDVVDAPPEHLPPRLADRYLALKAAGLL
jgi:uncharacterized protein (DUF58 family)